LHAQNGHAAKTPQARFCHEIRHLAANLQASFIFGRAPSLTLPGWLRHHAFRSPQ
jgi:hypothetical protein